MSSWKGAQFIWGNPGGSGIWNGSGMGREWGGKGKEEVSLRATWGQGGRDRTTQKEGFQVCKKGLKGELTRRPARGAKKGNCTIAILSICICVYNNCVNAANNLMCLGYK
jgi:hypothetical protein